MDLRSAIKKLLGEYIKCKRCGRECGQEMCIECLTDLGSIN